METTVIPFRGLRYNLGKVGGNLGCYRTALRCDKT